MRLHFPARPIRQTLPRASCILPQSGGTLPPAQLPSGQPSRTRPLPDPAPFTLPMENRQALNECFMLLTKALYGLVSSEQRMGRISRRPAIRTANRGTSPQRSANMSNIRSKDTKPEMLVRKALHRLGFRFRLHVRGLPGCPDIVLPKYRTVFQVKGCFWHGDSCRDGRLPCGMAIAIPKRADTEPWRDEFDASSA